jgi:hypothetical protein
VFVDDLTDKTVLQVVLDVIMMPIDLVLRNMGARGSVVS